MRSGAKVAVIGGVFVLMAGGIGYGAYSMLGDTVGGDGGTRSASEPSKVKTGPPSAEEIAETSKGFFDAWAAGDAAAASLLTNNESGAAPVLASYGEDARIGKVKITPGPAVGTKVPYTVKATVSYDGKSKPLSYASELTVVRGLTTGKALVDWAPTVVHPQLTEGATLRTGESSTPTIEAVDRNGKVLTKEKYPSLGPILDTLREKYGESAGGSPGVETWIEPADEAQPDINLLTLAKGKPGKVQTTIDAGAQAAAERAVKKYAEASVAAVQPSTGAIRAIANNRTDGYNAAMSGQLAPGSTMKIVTAAMIIQNGLGNMNAKVECPSTVSWEGVTFHNLDDFSIADATLREAFARSCNSTFIKPIKPLGDRAGSALGQEARTYFGLGQDNWQTGVASFDGSIPESSGAETAASYIGQGKVLMSPLNMASVTATVKNGSFKQPYLVARELDNRPFATARPLPAGVSEQLREMMRYTATSPTGTGTKPMAGVGGDKGAKTGSAEVDGQTSNSWFTGFSNDLAAAAVVQSGGHGGDAAGPVVAEVLRAVG
ncbi:penicillin-binding transpeptidase domain-containing protein [Streptomyces anulatus]|uniref:penicillin-binding transpeptidase domain-containing protein n=1 Tax=Streptomyces TaxID=1883 RepID=UPI00093D2595|nr:MULTISPECIES: penicillin-binding transpeptidase domain-containing protein [unclassified Streptomyces]OKJ08912.1 penicillin-binding protein [Streptomyces sp. TSRI0261]QNQ33005.1 penicillin-binding protein [Streptomyces sp. CB00271]